MAASKMSFIDEVIDNDIFEEYNLSKDKVLGSGSFGTVVLATSKDDPSDKMAIKMIYLSDPNEDGTSKRQDEEKMKMFLSEIQIMKRLRHCSVMPILSSVQGPNYLALLMPVCQGGTVMDSIKTLLQSQQYKYIRQLSQAVWYLHENNVVHLDIKPSNILIDDDSNILLSDFGFSRNLPNKEAEIFIDFGTQFFRAPETYADERTNPFKVDMYSFGISCWAILLKRSPSGEDFVSEIKKKLDIPCTYRRLVTILLNSDPTCRPLATQVLEVISKL